MMKHQSHPRSKTPKAKDLSVGKQKTAPNPQATGPAVVPFESGDEYDDEIQPKMKMRKKHVRRTAKEIERSFVCPYQGCSKVYGSEGSLNLHIKIKHNGGNKTDREKLARNLILAHDKGQLQKEIETIDLNLPPGTLQQAAMKVGLLDKVKEDDVLKQIYQKIKIKQEEAMARLQQEGGYDSLAPSVRNSIDPLAARLVTRRAKENTDILSEDHPRVSSLSIAEFAKQI